MATLDLPTNESYTQTHFSQSMGKKTLPATEISEAPDQINICPGLSLEGTYFFKDEGISLHIRDLKMRLFLLKIRIFLKIRNIF